jgi:hypothetical protein
LSRRSVITLFVSNNNLNPSNHATPLVVNILLMISFRVQYPHTNPTSAKDRQNMLYTVHLCNFFQNILTTGLIISKIWYQYRESKAAGIHKIGSSLLSAIRIVVESALPFTIELLLMIILCFGKRNEQFAVRYAIVPTIGLQFITLAHG